MTEKPILVRALHNYNPLNNDELKLDKDDLITVARKEDGGWWEGTLSTGKTGWFPSNYVEDVVTSAVTVTATAETPSPPTHPSPSVVVKKSSLEVQSTPSTDPTFLVQQAEYRRLALTELIESESNHLSELQMFWETYLLPLLKSDFLTPEEYKVMVGNFSEIIQTHKNCIFNLMKLEENKPQTDQCFGSIFLENAPKIEASIKSYCSNHPKAVQVVEKHRERLNDFVEGKGAKKPGILHVITLLSQPFRRLERYPMLLQEIERHVEEFHKDRGNMQRSIEYYKELEKACSALRKQKEMELEVLSGAIKNWEGVDVTQMGEIVFMNLVYLGYERHPRYFVLFPNTLLILSYSVENSSLVYEGKVPVSGITLRPLPDLEPLSNTFEIAGPMIDQITVSCSSKSIRETWLNHLNSILKTNRYPSFSSSPHQSFGQLTPPVQAWNISRLRPAPPFNPFLFENLQSAGLKKMKEGSTTPTSRVGSRAAASSSVSSMVSFVSSGYNKNQNQPPVVTNEDDLAILSIVDSFCNKNRHTVSSLFAKTSPGKSVSEKSPQPPKTLAQIVLTLRDDVSSLKKAMEEEQTKRLALQNLVHKRLPVVIGNVSNNNASNGETS